MLYFKFADKTHSWVLPVYENSVSAINPKKTFEWDKSIKFIGKVTEAEYDEQFREWQQLELF